MAAFSSVTLTAWAVFLSTMPVSAASWPSKQEKVLLPPTWQKADIVLDKSFVGHWSGGLSLLKE